MSRLGIRGQLAAIASALVMASAACGTSNQAPPNPRPGPGQIKVNKVYALSADEQDRAASETDGTTTILLGQQPDGFWPTGKVELSKPPAQRRIVFTHCVQRPTEDAAVKCNKRTGNGSFDNPRIERDMDPSGDNNFTFGKYSRHNGPIFLKAADVNCTSQVNPPNVYVVQNMLMAGQTITGKPKGTKIGGPPDQHDKVTFTCSVV
jgi:hypothetical protein